LTCHIYQWISSFGVWSIAIRDSEYDGTCFFPDVFKQVIGRVEHVEKKVSRFFVLYAIKDYERGAGTSYFGNVTPMMFESLIGLVHCQRIRPADHVAAEHHLWPARMYRRPVAQQLYRHLRVAYDDESLA
jgi:hypothetical protein